MTLLENTLQQIKSEAAIRTEMVRDQAKDIATLEKLSNWINSSGYNATPHVETYADGHGNNRVRLNIALTATMMRASELILLMQKKGITSTRIDDTSIWCDCAWDLNAWDQTIVHLRCRTPIYPKKAAQAQRRAA